MTLKTLQLDPKQSLSFLVSFKVFLYFPIEILYFLLFASFFLDKVHEKMPGLLILRKSLPHLREGEEVLARWSDEGWYFRGKVLTFW